MTDNPKISDEVAILAREYIEAVARGTIAYEKGGVLRLRSAEMLYRAYQTQERFSSQRIKELAQSPDASQNIREYGELTDDELHAKVIAIRGRQTG